MRITILYILFGLITSNLYSNESTFIFQPTNSNKKDVILYNSLIIKVNNVILEEHYKPYKIHINTNQLDTIVVIDEEQKTEIILTKLKADETYIIKHNPCSLYEIIPGNQFESTNLIRLITTNKDNSKIYFNSYDCFIDSMEIWKNDTTDYYIKHTNGHCPYSINTFNICEKNIEEINSKEIINCSKINVYFYGNEMYSLIYDYQNKEMKLVFDGYYEKNKKIKIRN